MFLTHCDDVLPLLNNLQNFHVSPASQAQTPQSGFYVPAAPFLLAPGGMYYSNQLVCSLSLMSCSVLSLDLCTNSLKCYSLSILFFLIPLRTNSYNSSKKTSASAQGILPLKSSVKAREQGLIALSVSLTLVQRRCQTHQGVSAFFLTSVAT